MRKLTKIKICGLTRIEDIHAVNTFLPDYIGFVFAKSRRRITIAQAKTLKSQLDQRIQAVGVLVNASIPLIVKLVEDKVIDIIQLHGDEPNDYIVTLKQYVSVPIIKAVRVKSAAQILSAQDLPCDMLLLDTYQEGQYGGSGKTFDYSMIPPLQKPYFIAGGIRCDNVTDVILRTHPYGVDISSGVETDGVKDPEKIKRVMQTVAKINEKEVMI